MHGMCFYGKYLFWVPRLLLQIVGRLYIYIYINIEREDDGDGRGKRYICKFRCGFGCLALFGII